MINQTLKTITIFLLTAYFLLSLSVTANAAPVPQIIKVKLNNKEVKIDKNELKIKALDNDLVIDLKPDSVDAYVFKMDKVDDTLVTTPYPYIRYTLLRGGNFPLKIYTKKGNILSEPLVLTLKIEATLSEEPWFYPSLGVYVLLIAGTIFYFWRIYNLQQRLKVQTLRNHIASDLHDEVGSTLNSIGLSMRTLQKKFGKDSDDLAKVLEKVRKTADDTNRNLRDTVWAINPDNDSFQQIFERMRTFAIQMFNDAEIAHTLENEVDMTRNFQISMEQRQNLYLMFKEAVNNIVKHAEATKAAIKMTQRKNGICIRIEDNGKGFNTQDGFEGNGLKNFKRRAADCFIDLTIDSTPSVGTTIEMVVPEL